MARKLLDMTVEELAADLEAFGHNNFSIELDDLGAVIEYVSGAGFEAKEEIDLHQLYLLGHSRGGGVVLLKAAEDKRVKKAVTWASVNEFGKFWSEEVMAHWKEIGVMYIENSRTKQTMPLYYQLYENYFVCLITKLRVTLFGCKYRVDNIQII